MALYLSDDWHALALSLAANALPERLGASARLLVNVLGGPGDVKYHQVILDGRLVEQGPGDPSGEPASVVLSVPRAEAEALQRGDLDVNVALMQGRVKVAGDMGSVLAIVPLTSSREYGELQAQLAAATEFA